MYVVVVAGLACCVSVLGQHTLFAAQPLPMGTSIPNQHIGVVPLTGQKADSTRTPSGTGVLQ